MSILARAIKEASARELADLAAFLHAEFEMETLDFIGDDGERVDAESVGKAIAAWAYMHLNSDEKGD